jgi:hypothetical protein
MEQEAFLLKISKIASKFVEHKVPHAVFVTELKRNSVETSIKLLESMLNNCTVWEYSTKSLYIHIDLLHETIYQSLRGRRNYSDEMDLWISCFGDRDMITWNRFSTLYLKKLREMYSDEEVNRLRDILFKFAASNDELISCSYFTQLAKTASFNPDQRRMKLNKCAKCLWLAIERVLVKRSWRLIKESCKEISYEKYSRGVLQPIPPNSLNPKGHSRKRSSSKEYFQKYVESKTLANPANYIQLTTKLHQLKSKEVLAESLPLKTPPCKKLKPVRSLVRCELLMMIYYKQYLKNTFSRWSKARFDKKEASFTTASLDVSRITMINIPQSENISMIFSKEASKIVGITSLWKIVQYRMRSDLKEGYKSIQTYPITALKNLERISFSKHRQVLSKSFLTWSEKSAFLHGLNLYTNRWIDAMTKLQYKLLFDSPSPIYLEDLNRSLPTRHSKQPSFGNK